MAKEIELKLRLLRRPEDLSGWKLEELLQGYIPTASGPGFFSISNDQFGILHRPECFRIDKNEEWVLDVLRDLSVGEIRVRSVDEKEFFLTIKSKEVGVERDEFEREISQESFKDLWQCAEDGWVVKMRYSREYTYESEEGVKTVKLELDVYKGRLEGISDTLEVEFETTVDLERFIRPEFATDAEDITKNKAWKNANLAKQRPVGQ